MEASERSIEFPKGWPKCKVVVKNQLLRARHITHLERMRPQFLIIGGVRCGTTSMHKYLCKHPWIARPLTKELHYFGHNYRKGLAWYSAHFSSIAYKRMVDKLFGCNIITGESSPSYIFYPQAAERARELVPDVKLIALLRNPVERAYSHYQLLSRRGHEPLSFTGAIDREPERARLHNNIARNESAGKEWLYEYFGYLQGGMYADQLENWLQVFPKEQFLILRSEDLFANPDEVLSQTFRFLGLPERTIPTRKAYNSGSYDRMGEAMRTRLSEYFESHNQRLCDMLGRHMRWGLERKQSPAAV